MPYKSLKQERFFHTPTGKEKIGQKIIDEFDQTSKGLKLPEHKSPESGYTKKLKTQI